MLNVQKKERKKLPEISPIFFSPIWSHVLTMLNFAILFPFSLAKTEKMAKIQTLEFRQSLYNFGRDPP